MTEEVHVGDIGTELEVTFKDGNNPVPLVTATAIKVRITDPNDSSILRNLTVVTPPGSDGVTNYFFVDGELHTPGTWYYQGTATFPGGYWQSAVLSFEVFDNLAEESSSPSASVSPSASASPSA